MQSVDLTTDPALCFAEEPLRIDDLLRLVHPLWRHRKILVMVNVINVYLDESGVHDDAPVCLVAGYAGGTGQWRKVELQWRKVLKEADVPLEKFHANNLIERHGFFHGWNGKDQQVLIESLAVAIAAYKIYPISFGVVVRDFWALSESQRRFFTGATINHGKLITPGCPKRPYFMPFQQCVKRAAAYAPVGGKAHFFLGLDTKFAKYAVTMFRVIKANPNNRYRDTLGTVSFPLAKDTPQLQAADFLAYLSYKHMLEGMDTGSLGEAQPALPLRILLDRHRDRHDLVFYDKDCMKLHLERTYELEGNWDGH